MKLSLEELLRRVRLLPPHEQAAALEALSQLLPRRKTAAAVGLESEGWESWVTRLFPSYAHSPFAFFHRDFWEWCWSIQADETADSFVALWYRGAAKSTSMQLGTVSLGARGLRRYAWYVSNTQEQADKHLLTIGTLLAKSSVEKYYPDLGQKKVNKYGSSEGWRRNRYRTAADFTIDALGLDTAARGGKLEEQRPDLIIFDDIDEKHDSPALTAKKIEIITTSLLPAGSSDLIVMFGQNLIARDSIASQLADGRAEFLANARISGPYPALRDAVFEKKPEGRGHRIARGSPTWPGFGVKESQAALDREGLDAFRRERQNEVDLVLPGALFPMWDERFHVITDSELIAGFKRLGVEVRRNPATGRAIMPDRFSIAMAQDVGTSKAHPSVSGWVARPSMAHPLNRKVFAHRELVFPDNWDLPKDQTVQAFDLGDIAKAIYEAETGHGERKRVRIRLLSHEATNEQSTYHSKLIPEAHRVFFHKSKGDRRRMEGVTRLQTFFAIHENERHPFRFYPVGHPQAGEPLPGCPDFLMVVADGQGELYFDEADGQLKVRQAIDSQGMKRGRYEIPKYRRPENASGEEADLPLKKDDDYIDLLKSLAVRWFTEPLPLTDAEREDTLRPVGLRNRDIALITDPEMASRAIMSQRFSDEERRREEESRHGDRRFHIPRVRFRR